MGCFGALLRDDHDRRTGAALERKQDIISDDVAVPLVRVFDGFNSMVTTTITAVLYW